MHDYKIAFEEASAYTDVAEILEHDGNGIYPYTPEHAVVAITNSAFAIELFLKSLLYLKKANSKKAGHDLLKLWEKCTEVDPGFTKSISGRIKTAFPDWSLSIEEQLEYQRQAFKDWRYHFEKGNEAKVDRMFLRAFRAILRDEVCRKLYGKAWSEYASSDERLTALRASYEKARAGKTE